MADLTQLEQKAKKATELSGFPINLLDVRRSVEMLLNEVGRYGFFNEYTLHNFSHVEEMLTLAEWIIPENSRNALTSAESFILTLSIYFHDIGLLISRKEYEERNKNDIQEWSEKFLFNGIGGEDYKSRLSELPKDERERLIYQEFVRHHHGSRIKNWLEGVSIPNVSADENIVEEIQRLVGPLPIKLRRDIAKVCESHNLDDIDNIEKYGLAQPYGNSPEEEADLQYVAVILRTVDLLQISKSRAPSTLFRIISPSDPISQTEWHKQNAVTRVRKKTFIDQDGRADPNAPSDTIEVFAHFLHAEGFFGLTEYLRYAESQLEKSFLAIEKSRKQHAARYDFPWRKIDDKKVEAEGFIPRTFGFELDQTKILTLLTGHTLYNDSTVVLRELTQNAIDAVRLQWQKGNVSECGKINILWNSSREELVITDNGTGMTQEVIENHLLKVGSSRYQDPQFIKENPSFSPISRFGIGVLTAFMVADSVEIITVSEEEDEARQVSLRTVHGKYLIRLLSHSSEVVSDLKPHGTTIRLRLRPSAKKVDVLATLRRWILFPECNVHVEIDGQPAVRIGYKNPEEALNLYLKNNGKRLVGSREYRVVQKNICGLDLAYAISRDEFFKDWSLIGVGETRTSQDFEEIPVGTCIEGIAVDFNTPGFEGRSILAIANARGKTAPRTNVARSALEDTNERTATISQIYELYAAQVADEVKRLAAIEEYSLSWAVGQAAYISAAFASPRTRVSDRATYAAAIGKLPLFLVESDGRRISASLEELETRRDLWLIEAPLVRSVENLIREAPTNVSARSVI